MDIESVDHIEFYVGDAQQSAFYLCTAFGFRICGQAGPETGQTGYRSLLLRQGGIELVLTSALNADHPAASYVMQHGDGVANIAFRVSDAAKAFELAVERGAVAVEQPTVHSQDGTEVVTAAVLGFGDVAHRFVQRSGDREHFLPGVMDITDAGPEQGEELLRTVDHAAICLPAGLLRPTVAFYEEVFGFSQIFEEFIEVGTQAMDSKVVQSPSGNVTFTLIEPVTDREPGQIDAFLARHGGAGVQHLALLCDDIVGTVRTLQERGLTFLRTPGSYYDQLQGRFASPIRQIEDLRQTNVLIDEDHWGQVFQIFTQSQHVRKTFFWEVIDRHGARTFGSGNIKALYEAVAREKDTTS
ncbi:4-hydroxyphenylpyruvate dioxygenase [Streptomyces somaliensis]|uniref:4-hydroxyphenylpyruvate dioxygenase n=1 Tax=Streptomyces somaliensis TaxID=78355 RepID=UPI0020CFCD42|nr:4-hydroxyphenylpyruvate dioxygenase [Streptomyces somaliensis]MCP9946814.1 4-hydroxyphenylpyruvate dioxygenase [Streptomyces somaliensis]MCP9963449.1 4-hydroxyphenylpyruvate dioxygenase [Streptomyces somaliensis]